MNSIQTGIAVSVGVLMSLAFLFFGPQFMSIFFAPTDLTGSAIQSADSLIAPSENSVASEQKSLPPTTVTPMQDIPTTLTITDSVIGNGAEALPGKQISVHYTGYLPDGTVFDSSVTRGEPFPFVLGAGRVIAGWDQGLVGMKVGGKRKLIIPPNMAYGDQARGDIIKPNSTLIFDVELLSVQ